MELQPTLGICGDPLVGRALTLLLRGSGYKVRFLLLAQSFWEPQQALKDIWLLVLTPTPELSTERRNALVRSLKETSEAENMPVLELVTPLEARREEAGNNESWHMVRWPCRIQELEWWIEAAWQRYYETKGERIGSAINTMLRI
jgi:hypothetical protein